MEKLKKHKSYIIIFVIALLIILVYIIKQTTGIELDTCTDPNCETHNHEEKLYKVYNFSSKFCYVCDEMSPIYNKIKEEFEHDIDFEYVDVNLNSKLANKYKIEYTPTYIIVDKDGNVLDKIVGYRDENEFREFVKKWVDSDDGDIK